MRKTVYILLFLSAFSLAAFEVSGDGSPVDLTRIGVSARWWGLGRAGTALSDDSGALLLNPASMAMARSFELSGMSTQVLGVTNYTLINSVLPLNDSYQAFGFSFINENAGTIIATSGKDAYGHPVKGGTIENSNSIISLGLASKVAIPDLIDDLYLGVLFKGYHKVLGDLTATSMAVDFGAIYKWTSFLSLGFTARNALQSGINYSTSEKSGEEHYDTDYIAGLALSLLNNDLTLAVDQYTNAKFGRTYAGLEYWLANTVALRTGLAENEMTLGVGLRYEFFQLDVGYRYQDAPLDNQVYFSVTLGNARRLFLTRPKIEIIENDSRPASVPEEMHIL
ncbi:MAG: type IX secretion system membrane protein PorP/SprF [Candidatus Margulisbacteria bacterium]|jgi:hypothetical protein|nr:type IX secretion system membrane protein PorP/SprF [Candidatus Margulisiibacteriota bacterium]